jgi:HK97 family phage prohead protease
MSAGADVQPRSVRFAGYAAVFGKRDSGGDVILPGAFAETLAARKAAGVRLPLLWQHRTGQRIGWVEVAEEDRHGLRVIAALSPSAGPAAKALADVDGQRLAALEERDRGDAELLRARQVHA